MQVEHVGWLTNCFPSEIYSQYSAEFKNNATERSVYHTGRIFAIASHLPFRERKRWYVLNKRNKFITFICSMIEIMKGTCIL